MTGKVFLIGAGCGEADLITIKGLKRLLESDVVLYDSLVDENLVNNLSGKVEKIYVGKRYNQKSMPQDEINSLLIEKAKQGKTVARLKGGDPYVFGRGSEEAQILEYENIYYEVIPGISSAIAVPASAGIPVTHRQISRSVTVLTGSTIDKNKAENVTQIDYKALTKLGGTIVFLMGYHHIDEIINNFLDAGMNCDMPCAIISKGCSAEQKVIKGNIKNILSKISAQKINAPIVIVIGACVNLNLKEWFYEKSEYKKDFKGLKIGVVGTESFTKKLSSKFSNTNAEIIDLSFLDVVATTNPLPNLKDYTWIVFTSQNGIEQFFLKLKKEKIDIRLLSNLKFAVIGSGTFEKLVEYGIYADFIPSRYDSQTLAKEILQELQPYDKLLICRAENGSDDIINALEKNNYTYTDYKIYALKENELKKNIISTLKKEYFDVDYLVFGSANGVNSFFKNFYEDFNKNIKIVCIGKRCAEALKNYDVGQFLIAEKYNIEGIIDCIEKDFNKD